MCQIFVKYVKKDILGLIVLNNFMKRHFQQFLKG